MKIWWKLKNVFHKLLLSYGTHLTLLLSNFHISFLGNMFSGHIFHFGSCAIDEFVQRPNMAVFRRTVVRFVVSTDLKFTTVIQSIKRWLSLFVVVKRSFCDELCFLGILYWCFPFIVDMHSGDLHSFELHQFTHLLLTWETFHLSLYAMFLLNLYASGVDGLNIFYLYHIFWWCRVFTFYRSVVFFALFHYLWTMFSFYVLSEWLSPIRLASACYVSTMRNRYSSFF